MASDKPWYRQWAGVPEGLRELRAVDPGGREYELRVGRVGMPMIDLGRLNPIVWAIGWLVNVVKYREAWEVRVLLVNPRRWSISRDWRMWSRAWFYEGYQSKHDAAVALAKFGKGIENGTWHPQGDDA